jgi:hypothetical protein
MYPGLVNAQVWRDLYRTGRGDLPRSPNWSACASAGALTLVATAAPGDVAQTDSTPIEEFAYRLSSTTGQEGCIVTIPDREALPRFFPGRDLEIGEFGLKAHGTSARHWIVTYRTKTHD